MSADEVHAEIALISERLRRWRENDGLTLQELAGRSGVATSTIQKVETGQMTPSVAILLKIARGLDRAASDFIAASRGQESLIHLGPEDRPRFGPRDGSSFERLSGDLPDPRLEMWRVTLDPAAGVDRHAAQDQGEALIVCERGRPTIMAGESEFTLSPGDTLHFKASLGMLWRNDTTAKAVFTLTGTLPSELRASLRTPGSRRRPQAHSSA